MVGLNFYGNDFVPPAGGGQIVGHQYVDILQQHRPRLQWDNKSAEHVAEYISQGERHIVYYPTPWSIKQRLDLATEHGVGVSIWELGQGLNMFMDLL